MSLAGKHILVLGLGESGLAMAQWCLRRGARVRVADTRAEPPARAQLEGAVDVELRCGQPFDESLLEGVDVTALSPGLALYEPVVVAGLKQQIPVVGEIELFAQALHELGWREGARLIAVTGTNGKTTTTSMVGEILRTAGLDTVVCGNIAPAALTALMQAQDAGRRPQAWVLELSSFQLETTQSLDPDAAAVLNVTDDHLDRYDDLEDYAQTKARIFMACGAQVLNRGDARTLAMALPGHRVSSFGLDAPPGPEDYGMCVRLGSSWLCRGGAHLMATADLRVAGLHNVENALAAAALCHAVGIDDAAVVAGLAAFKGLEHRVEWFASFDGIDVFDDSKGTNVGATVAALNGLRRQVVLIAGGDGKGQDFSPLMEPVARYARFVALIGVDAPAIEVAIAGCRVPLARFDTLQAATRAAFERARPGDAVLLSPACASLDMFRNYAHRAEVFIDAVKKLAAERAAG